MLRLHLLLANHWCVLTAQLYWQFKQSHPAGWALKPESFARKSSLQRFAREHGIVMGAGARAVLAMWPEQLSLWFFDGAAFDRMPRRPAPDVVDAAVERHVLALERRQAEPALIRDWPLSERAGPRLNAGWRLSSDDRQWTLQRVQRGAGWVSVIFCATPTACAHQSQCWADLGDGGRNARHHKVSRPARARYAVFCAATA